MLRMFEGRFGRVVLEELAAGAPVRAGEDPAIVMVRGTGEIRFLNPGESCTDAYGERAVVFHASSAWLAQGFPAVFAANGAKAFPQPSEPLTPRIRQLAEALSVEMLNDRFMSAERLEFMLGELVISILDAYHARQHAAATWRGSRLEDSRIRRAVALLRERPSKEMNIDDLASQVGLSRSRFYDLFQLCTGFSPRAYLDLLCVETAITRLASGEGRISDVSAELGFSAQSNFTRFFLQHVGVPPSEYRRSSTRKEPPRG
ncbi:MAG TPA: AraC family transcriptional regulator [Burkholderiales bacterium]|nr:AraC family transcriptional regulator [Burkholderiales bacterium]